MPVVGLDTSIYTTHKRWDKEKGHGDNIKRWHNVNKHQMPSVSTGMIAKYNVIRVINIYALLGSEKKKERESFYNTEVPYLLPIHHTDIIFAGIFNCVLCHSDATGQRKYSRALDIIVTGIRLHDTGEQKSATPSFTQYTIRDASRLDRIYNSNMLQPRKQGVLTAVAAFTDHLAIVLRVASRDPISTHGRGYWMINTSVLRDRSFRRLLQYKMGHQPEPQEILPHRVTLVGR
jgi:hypothetical protein